MELVEKFIEELVVEASFIAEYLQRNWQSLSHNEQLYTLAVICAACLLLGLRNPRRATTFKSTIGQNEDWNVFKQFMFACVLLMIFTLGVDIAVEAIS